MSPLERVDIFDIIHRIYFFFPKFYNQFLYFENISYIGFTLLVELNIKLIYFLYPKMKKQIKYDRSIFV